jgi:uncharacterized protein YndB with AHSA1/START domain
MNTLIDILLIIAAIVALLLFAALFLKKEYVIAKEITIHQPISKVFAYIKLLKNQAHYNKWWMMDPYSKKEFTGTDGTVGFTAKWDSAEARVGNGEQKITAINERKRIDFNIHFLKPFENVCNVYMTTTSKDADKTTVRWVFTGKNKYPLNLMNILMSSILGKDLKTSITNLKDVLEKNNDLKH